MINIKQSASWELLYKTILAWYEDLLLVGLHVKADFVACVEVDVTLYIIRSVGKVEHFLWKVTPVSNFVKWLGTHLLNQKLFHIQDQP